MQLGGTVNIEVIRTVTKHGTHAYVCAHRFSNCHELVSLYDHFTGNYIPALVEMIVCTMNPHRE